MAEQHRGGSGNFAEDREKGHQKLDVKAASTAAVISKTIRNAHLKRVRKGDRTVTAEAVNLITPDLI